MTSFSILVFKVLWGTHSPPHLGTEDNSMRYNVCTARAEFNPCISGQPYIEMINVKPYGKEADVIVSYYTPTAANITLVVNTTNPVSATLPWPHIQPIWLWLLENNYRGVCWKLALYLSNNLSLYYAPPIWCFSELAIGRCGEVNRIQLQCSAYPETNERFLRTSERFGDRESVLDRFRNKEPIWQHSISDHRILHTYGLVTACHFAVLSLGYAQNYKLHWICSPIQTPPGSWYVLVSSIFLGFQISSDFSWFCSGRYKGSRTNHETECQSDGASWFSIHSIFISAPTLCTSAFVCFVRSFVSDC